VERVFSQEEQRACTNINYQVVWKYWAAKEAAYKAIKRLDESVIFEPRQFRVCLKHLVVHYREQKLPICFSSNGAYLHCVCTSNSLLTQTQISIQRLNSTMSASAQARSTLLKSISKTLVVAEEQLYFFKKKGTRRSTIPEVSVAGHCGRLISSISHHGMYVAVAWQQNDSKNG
jgi:phosphopantetheinyl transferase (holo-ACP synthase)